jgi:hypothetical protein
MPPKRKYLSKASNDIVTKPNRSNPRPMPYPSPPTMPNVQSSPSFEYASAAAPLRRDCFNLDSCKPSSHDLNHLESNSLDFDCLDFNNSSVNVPDLNVPDPNVPDFSGPDSSLPGSNDFTFYNLDSDSALWNDTTPPASPATPLPNTAQQSQDTPRKRPKQSSFIVTVCEAPEPLESSEMPPTPPLDLHDKQTDLNHPQSPPAQSENTMTRKSSEPLNVLEPCETQPTPPPSPPPSHPTKSNNYSEADAIKSSIKSPPPKQHLLYPNRSH